MTGYADWVLRQNLGKSLLVDSNLFLLFVVGSYSRKTISTFKRTRDYSEADFRDVVRIIDQFLPLGRTLTTPHILTEVSNLAGQATGERRAGILQTLARIIPRIREQTIAAADAVATSAFVPFGLTDAVVVTMSAADCLVLTDDLPLAHRLEQDGRPVLNFNYIRIERARSR
ncbi:MAG: hypothetical protein H6509_05805 [Bryobacterales bacterium]|nr:hypothetical protein [Acidobacteriota bacterium]MCB9384109.1 hypothetical protein [Bryobacterales bacterium]